MYWSIDWKYYQRWKIVQGQFLTKGGNDQPQSPSKGTQVLTCFVRFIAYPLFRLEANSI